MLDSYQPLLGTGFYRMAIIFIIFNFSAPSVWFHSVFLSVLNQDLLKWCLIHNFCL